MKTLIDLGEVTWLIQCEQASRVLTGLRTLATEVRFERPPTSAESVFTLSVLLEAAGDLGIDLTDPLYAWDRISARLRHSPTTKARYAAMIDALAGLRRDAISDDQDLPF